HGHTPLSLHDALPTWTGGRNLKLYDGAAFVNQAGALFNDANPAEHYFYLDSDSGRPNFTNQVSATYRKIGGAVTGFQDVMWVNRSVVHTSALQPHRQL